MLPRIKNSLISLMLVSSAVAPSNALGQTIHAAGKPREVNITTDSAAGWLPSEALENDAQKAAGAYFSALGAENYRQAYGMMTESNRSQVSFEQFEAQGRKFHALAGPLQRREFLKMTWTKDPTNAPRLGVYVAIDVAAVFAGVDRECGYVVLYQGPTGGPFEVARSESNFIDNVTAKSIVATQSSAELDRLWAALSSNCPNYSPVLAH